MDAAAGEMAAGGVASLAEYGVGIFSIAGLLWVFYKIVMYFGSLWADSVQKREDISREREKEDRDIRKKMYESFNELSKALEKNSAAIEKNAIIGERHAEAMTRLTSAVGNLPCTMRDPGLRTRSTDVFSEGRQKVGVGD